MSKKFWIFLMLFIIVFGIFPCNIFSASEDECNPDCSMTPPSNTYQYCGCARDPYWGSCYQSSCVTKTWRDDVCEIYWMGFECQCAATKVNKITCDTTYCQDDWDTVGVACCSPSRGVCGSSDGGSFCDYSSISDKCDRGRVDTKDDTASDGVFNWQCDGSCGGSSVNCSATHLADISGVCGSATGQYFPSAPTSNLCSAGTASSVSFHPATAPAPTLAATPTPTPYPTPVPKYVGSPYATDSRCSSLGGGGYCGDFSSTPSTGATCKVNTKVDLGIIYTDKCGGDATVKCCVPTVGTPVTNTTGCSNLSGYCAEFGNIEPDSGDFCTVINRVTAGTIYTGVCSGDASVRCCVPLGSSGSTPTAPTPTPYPPNSFSWVCNKVQCSGSSPTCIAYLDTPPTYSSILLKNSSGATVVTESGSRNQMCQSIFRDTSMPGRVIFEVTGADAQGVGDINTIQIRLRGASTYTSPAVAAVNGVATIVVDLNNVGLTAGNYNVEAIVNDDHVTLNSGWVDTGRDFKYWDCQVEITGSAYDNSNLTPCSTSNNYSTLIDSSKTYGLGYIDVSTTPSTNRTMTVASPHYNVNYGGSKLDWNKSYLFTLTGFPGANPTGLRITDIGLSTTKCFGGVQFNLNNNGLVDPYSNPVRVRIDFASVMDQESWFRTLGAGIAAANDLNNFIPVTCTSTATPVCSAEMSISGTWGNKSLVSAGGSITDTYSVGKDIYVKSNVVGKSYSYQDFYNKYFVNLGLGVVLDNGEDILDVGGTGLVLVDGDLTIGDNITVSNNEYLMVIVNGDINVNDNVTNLDGIFIANNINIGGSNNTKLIINGMLYGSSSVIINRSYATKSKNNTDSAVDIDYRPSLIFNLPGRLMEAVSKWRMN